MSRGDYNIAITSGRDHLYRRLRGGGASGNSARQKIFETLRLHNRVTSSGARRVERRARY